MNANTHTNNPNLLQEDLALPAAILYQSRVTNNVLWMQNFADAYDVQLAPHGKTTMAPALFKQQLEAGAWAISLATAAQTTAAYQQGIKRILLANQLVGRQNMVQISHLLTDSDISFYCLVDSLENVKQLDQFFTKQGQRLAVLIEVGVSGGRCGCRSAADAQKLAIAIQESQALDLVGLEFYEGIIHGETAEQEIRSFLQYVIDICHQLIAGKFFNTAASEGKVIVTGAGSAWYDMVAEMLDHQALKNIITPVLRPGCYIAHDHGIYQQAQAEVITRSSVAAEMDSQLQSALEVWAYVQSIPEPGHAIIGLGKRDAAFDAGLPQPALHFRPNTGKPSKTPPGWRTTNIMDQHSYLHFPAEDDLRVGDMLAFTTSHPCLTFDKWREIYVIDDNYNVLESIATFF